MKKVFQYLRPSFLFYSFLLAPAVDRILKVVVVAWLIRVAEAVGLEVTVGLESSSSYIRLWFSSSGSLPLLSSVVLSVHCII